MATLEPITLTVVQVIKAADVQAGDTVVFSFPDRLSVAEQHRFGDHMQTLFPDGVKVILLEGGATCEGILRMGSNEAEV
jgi:hypothetical protein